MYKRCGWVEERRVLLNESLLNTNIVLISKCTHTTNKIQRPACSRFYHDLFVSQHICTDTHTPYSFSRTSTHHIHLCCHRLLILSQLFIIIIIIICYIDTTTTMLYQQICCSIQNLLNAHIMEENSLHTHIYDTQMPVHHIRYNKMIFLSIEWTNFSFWMTLAITTLNILYTMHHHFH